MYDEKIREIVREIGVYGIAYNIEKEKLLTSDPVQAMNEGLLDKLASNWEQSFEDMDIDDLEKLTSEEVEKIIKDGDCDGF